MLLLPVWLLCALRAKIAPGCGRGVMILRASVMLVEMAALGIEI